MCLDLTSPGRKSSGGAEELVVRYSAHREEGVVLSVISPIKLEKSGGTDNVVKYELVFHIVTKL